MLDIIKSFFNVVLLDKASFRFAIGITVGFAFSISVILSTVGIMDGFEYSLKLGLKKSMGDINVFSRDGLFDFDKKVSPKLVSVSPENVTPILRKEAFVVHESKSKGVMVKGIETTKFNHITGLTLNFESNEIAVGKELARFFNVKVGDEIVIAFTQSTGEDNGLPLLESFVIGQIVSHGIYQKDLRFIYMDINFLQENLEISNLANSFIMKSLNKNNIDYTKDSDAYMANIEESLEIVEEELGNEFYGKPFWEDFEFLIRAVSTEKYMIGLILQLVVVISIFNVLAFVIYVNEKRSRELFLFQALGMSQKRIFNYMLVIILSIWIFACLLSVGMVSFFNFSLNNLPFFKLPGEIYTLQGISISLDLFDYITVFGIAFFWLFTMSWFGLARLRKKAVLTGLRREFT